LADTSVARKGRDDLSRFLVHLTREYGGRSAEANLLSILLGKRIEARNFHCLFNKEIARSEFTRTLQDKFKTVCFTEAPLNQIRHLAKDIKGRNVQLQPFGLVFWKDDLLRSGANPALYVSSQAGGVRELLLSEFRCHFETSASYKALCQEYEDSADAIIHYYSMINVISGRYDFSWEREWRRPGHHDFKYKDLVAIVAKAPDSFRRTIKSSVGKRHRDLLRIPIISTEWSYERIVEEMSIRIWQA